MSRSRQVLGGTGIAVVAVVVAVIAFVWFFLGASRTLVVAGHDTEVRPTLDQHLVVRTGPLLPDVRRSSGGPVGVELRLGKTREGSAEDLVERYAFIAASPESQVAKVRDAVLGMALEAALRGVALGLVPVVVWLLLGPHRRGELWRGLRTRQGTVAAVLVLLVPILVWQPWSRPAATEQEARPWLELEEWLGFPVPEEAQGLQVATGPASSEIRRLVHSAVRTYEKSLAFYEEAAADAADIDGIRSPGEGETVALLVSDRHDNIGMDPVARAVADRAGASAVLDAGDDTSTGQPWESFSIDSLHRAFEDYDQRYAVGGNHDHGSFVTDYLDDLGWEVLDGEVVDGPGESTLLGVSDPRSSGLGAWRDATGQSYEDVADELADTACEHREETGERVDTVLVHDWDLAEQALQRGCVRLVLAGHIHVQTGPVAVTAADGSAGYYWTNGTTGGAAYAVAVGSKPRRNAEMTLVTYRDGTPVGLQLVRLRTDGEFEVGTWQQLSVGVRTPGR